MDDVGWPLAAIVFSTGAAFFFSLHKLILQMFSKVRLSEAYKEADLPNRSDEISENEEKLVMVCSIYWRLANICIFISILWFLYDGNGGEGESSDDLQEHAEERFNQAVETQEGLVEDDGDKTGFE